MGDMATLAKARKELEELYSGIPDESVNLTFQDFVQVKQLPATLPLVKSNINSVERKTSMKSSLSSLTKLPSLDFNNAFEESSVDYHQNNKHQRQGYDHNRGSYFIGTSPSPAAGQGGGGGGVNYSNSIHGSGHAAGGGNHHDHGLISDHRRIQEESHRGGHYQHPNYHHRHQDELINSSIGFDETVSSSGTISSRSNHMMMPNFMEGKGRRRRPGIPHSNICSICSVYIYMFRNNRCLVCGRVYCRQCVSISMGEMTEGRKCIQCLGKRFSSRYIGRAGKIGCCGMGGGRAKQQELEWAEKGARKSGNTNAASAYYYSRSELMVSPTTSHVSHTPSFVSPNSPSPYSPYINNSPGPTNFHFPL